MTCDEHGRARDRPAKFGRSRPTSDNRTAELWRRENSGAIASSNAWVEQNGLPLSKYRMF